MLKYGAYDLFKEEREGRSEERSNAFCEADIEQILEKNAKVITIDSQGGSSFSKASFVTDTSDEIDIDDPNFWTKIVGLKDHSQDVMGPRVRKKVEYKEVGDGEDLVEGGFEEENEWNKTDRDVLVKQVFLERSLHCVAFGVRLGPMGGDQRQRAAPEALGGVHSFARGGHHRAAGASLRAGEDRGREQEAVSLSREERAAREGGGHAARGDVHDLQSAAGGERRGRLAAASPLSDAGSR